MAGSPPTAGHIDHRRLRLLLDRAALEVDTGSLPSCQVAVAKDGDLVAYETFGAATPTTRYVLQSAGRPIVAGAAWLLLGDGRLKLDEHVADVIPEFADNGKDGVTVEHLLTHRGGFPYAPLGFPHMTKRADRLAAFGRWRLSGEPGGEPAFHLTSAGWVIAELVERRSGAPLSRFIADQIAQPLGLTIELGVAPERQTESVAPMVAVGTSANERPDAWGPWYLASAEVLGAGEPSHGVVATAADVTLYYQALLRSGLWPPAVVANATSVHATMASATSYSGTGTGHVGLFVMVRGEGASVFFPATVSAATFGCPGQAYQTGFMDPTTGLSFAFLTNGYPPSAEGTLAGAHRVDVLSTLAGDIVV